MMRRHQIAGDKIVSATEQQRRIQITGDKIAGAT
jgi:hypothetical protein